MRFFAPTNVHIEKNCVRNHKKELLALGTRALIVTGRHSAKINGSLDDVLSVLEESSVSFRIFSEIEENPSVETVAQAAEIGKEFQADFVIGIGGGSPLDAAKAIALLIVNPAETADCLYISKDLKALPIAAIPTTCGTGSEVTPNAVLTRHAFKTKKSISYHLYPDLALVDGRYLAHASRNLLVNTAVDALAHCVESRLSIKSNIYNQMFSEYGLKLWSVILPYLKEDAVLNDEAYETLMLTSTVAGMAIAQTGTSLPHALSYEITYNHGVPHGKACGFFLAAYMEEYARNKPEDVEQILALLGFATLEDFRDYLHQLLGTLTISEQELNTYADNVMDNPSKLSTYPFEINRDAIVEMLRKSLEIE